MTTGHSHWDAQAYQLLQVLAGQRGDHPSLDGPATHMLHWLKMRRHLLGLSEEREMGAIMARALALQNEQNGQGGPASEA